MLRKAGWAASVMMALTSCGNSSSDGSVISGPLGQKPLMTKEVQIATRIGLDACIDALNKQAPLSALQARGFAPWRGGYRLKIDNPLIFAGNSSVSAKFQNGACRVSTGPVYPIEIQTVQSITRAALDGEGQRKNVRFRQAGEIIEVIIR